MQKWFLENFIEHSNRIHSNKYDYSKTQFKTCSDRIIIICRMHGEFNQRMSKHLEGQGCKRCKQAGHFELYTLESFIEKARTTHGEKYRYFSYVRNNIKIPILCDIHGIFHQRPHSHLSGAGCPVCGKEKASNFLKENIKDLIVRITREEFLLRATAIHGVIYNYSNVVIDHYSKNTLKVSIECPNHGIFNQSIKKHLSGQGCPKCTSRQSKGQLEFLDRLNIPEENREKYFNINGKKYFVDGFCGKTNMVFEFFGSYWHGDLRRYDANDLNPHCYKTFGQLNKETMARVKLFEDHGYKVFYMWEDDWNKIKNSYVND